jgi:cyclopropane fatty-acyl-phospholipid synthase-like methyltransferase
MKNQIVADYYDMNSEILIDVWGDHDNFALHCGYYDENNPEEEEPIIKMNRLIAKEAQIKKSDRVLDAGSGVGGSSIWFAKNYGATITGISLSEKEIKLAQKFAQEKSVLNVEFRVMDYHRTGFPAQSFDTILAVESLCYSSEKEKFLDECLRLLKTSGKIVIVDVFSKSNQQYCDAIERINAYYSCELGSLEQFRQLLKRKFARIKILDISQNVKKSYIEALKKIQKMYLTPAASSSDKKYIKKEIDIMTQESECFKQGLLKYQIIVAHKNENSNKKMLDIRDTGNGCGMGIFAKRDISKGSLVFTWRGRKKAGHYPLTVGQRWLQVDKEMWISPWKSNPGYWINHSCTPNTGIKNRVDIVAMRDIKKGEQITFDYSSDTGEDDWQMLCHCGSNNCRGIITSYNRLPVELKRKYGDNIADFLKNEKRVRKTERMSNLS